MTRFTKYLLFIIPLFLMLSASGQQSQVDSLKHLLERSRSDTTTLSLKIKLAAAFEDIAVDSSVSYYQSVLHDLSTLYPQSLDDTLQPPKQQVPYLKIGLRAHQGLAELHLGNDSYNLAVEHFGWASTLAKRLGDNISRFNSYNQLGIAYFYQGEYDAAFNVFKKQYAVALNMNDSLKLARCFNNMGVVYRNQGYTEQALEKYMGSLRIYEELNHSQGMSTCYNNIGVIHWNQENFVTAIEYYRKALALSIKLNDRKGIAKGYNNIGVVSDDMGAADSALFYYSKALEIYTELSDRYGMAAIFNNLGVIYKSKSEKATSPAHMQSMANLAISSYSKSLAIANQLGDKSGIAMTSGNLASIYLHLGTQLRDKSMLSKTLEYGLRSFFIAGEIGSVQYRNDASSHLMNAYKLLGDSAKAFKYAEEYIKSRQSLFNAEKSKVLADAEAQFQSEKKQQQIDRQMIVLENQMLEARRQRTLRNGVLVALALALALAGFIYYGYRLKRDKNIEVLEKNSILEQSNAEILAQRDELEAQRDMVLSQNRELEDMHTHITNSLQYAQSIQAALLPSEAVIEQISRDYFVIMRPCELVSGDFYWATIFDQYQVFCVADCTGHGVPGAFMSILGITALNDIVIRHRITKPSEVLRHLRESVIEALSQNDPSQTHKDGLDIAICVFNTKTRELQFAGAGIPMWLVVPSTHSIDVEGYPQLESNGYILCDIKGDRSPVGLSPILKPFTNHSFKLKSESAKIYLATDGYADQFGGENRAKYRVSRLKQFVLTNCQTPMNHQKAALEAEFELWKGSCYQVDDVALLGLSV